LCVREIEFMCVCVCACVHVCVYMCACACVCICARWCVFKFVQVCLVVLKPSPKILIKNPSEKSHNVRDPSPVRMPMFHMHNANVPHASQQQDRAVHEPSPPVCKHTGRCKHTTNSKPCLRAPTLHSNTLQHTPHTSFLTATERTHTPCHMTVCVGLPLVVCLHTVIWHGVWVRSSAVRNEV